MDKFQIILGPGLILKAMSIVKAMELTFQLWF